MLAYGNEGVQARPLHAGVPDVGMANLDLQVDAATGGMLRQFRSFHGGWTGPVYPLMKPIIFAKPIGSLTVRRHTEHPSWHGST